MWESYLTGLLVSGGIIIAIGAQNAYVLGLAVRREHHWWSAGLCMSTDLLLITVGMFGVSAVLLAMPEAMAIMRWLGVVFLAWLAAQGLYRAIMGRQGLERAEAEKRSVLGITSCLAADRWRNRADAGSDCLEPGAGIKRLRESVARGHQRHALAWPR